MKAKRALDSPGRQIIASLQELADVLRRGQPLESRFTVRTVRIPTPTRYGSRSVKATRRKIGASQAIFAQIMGVSKKLVEHWEAGIRQPSPMACRLLDALNRSPGDFVEMVQAA